MSGGCESIPILLVGLSEADRAAVRDYLEPCNWSIEEAADCRQALGLLVSNPEVLVLCECDAPGGGWKRILGALAEIPNAPNLVVCSRLADERLWSEVLNLGGYDLLLTPFDSNEVIRVSHQAWFSWKRERKGPPPVESLRYQQRFFGSAS